MEAMAPLSEMRKPVGKKGIGLVGRKKSRVRFGYAHFDMSYVVHWATNIVQPPSFLQSQPVLHQLCVTPPHPDLNGGSSCKVSSCMPASVQFMPTGSTELAT